MSSTRGLRSVGLVLHLVAAHKGVLSNASANSPWPTARATSDANAPSQSSDTPDQDRAVPGFDGISTATAPFQRCPARDAEASLTARDGAPQGASAGGIAHPADPWAHLLPACALRTAPIRPEVRRAVESA